MDKKQALTTLIKHSFILAPEKKAELLDKVFSNSLSEEKIDQLGTLLAQLKKQSLESASEDIAVYDELIKKLEAESEKKTS